MKIEIYLNDKILYQGIFKMISDYYCFKDKEDFITKLKYDQKHFHLKRHKDYSLEMIKQDNKLTITMLSQGKELVFKAKILEYQVNDDHLSLSYQLNDEIFKYLIRRIYD